MFMLLNVSTSWSQKNENGQYLFSWIKKKNIIICFLGFKNEKDQLLKRNKKEVIPKEEGNYKIKGHFYDKKDKF